MGRGGGETWKVGPQGGRQATIAQMTWEVGDSTHTHKLEGGDQQRGHRSRGGWSIGNLVCGWTVARV